MQHTLCRKTAKMATTLKLLYISVLILFPMMGFAYEAYYDPAAKTTKIVALMNIDEPYPLCTQYKFKGTISKVSGKYPTIEIWIRNGKNTEAFDLEIGEFDMATIRSLDSLISPGKKVIAEIQRCGSGAIPSPISIKLDR